MKSDRPNFAYRLCFTLVVAIMTGGCGFDPAKDHIHSRTQPNNFYAKGILWIPMKLDRTADEWFFVPESVAIGSGEMKPRPGSQIDVYVAGKVWRCTRQGDETSLFQGPLDPPDAPPSDTTVWTWIVTVTIAVAAGLGVLFALDTFQKATETAKATDKKVHDLAAREEILKTERENVDREKKILALIRQPEEKKQAASPTVEEYEFQSIAVRNLLLRGAAASRELLVKYAVDTRAGKPGEWAAGFEWEILLDGPAVPALQIHRNGVEIRRESGQVKGQFGSVLKRGERSLFTFTVIDGPRTYADPVVIELSLPPFDIGSAPMSKAEQRRRKEEWRQEQYRLLEAYIKDPEILRVRKAEIDEEARRKFGDD